MDKIKALKKGEFYTEEEIAYFYDLDLKKAVSIISYLVGNHILERIKIYRKKDSLKFSLEEIENSNCMDFYEVKKDLILTK